MRLISFSVGLSSQCDRSSKSGGLFGEDEPFVRTNAPGSQFQLLLISNSISDPLEDESFEVHVFSILIIVCVFPGEMPTDRILLLLLGVKETLK